MIINYDIIIHDTSDALPVQKHFLFAQLWPEIGFPADKTESFISRT